MLPADPVAPIVSTAGSPFLFLTFLAAPALLTNASTVLALGTANRLGRASDRARAAAAAIVGATRPPDDPLLKFQRLEFRLATRRASLLVHAIRRFYLAAACFAAGTCIALVGAFGDYLDFHLFDRATQILTIAAAIAGLGALIHGCVTLLAETRLALQALDQHQSAIDAWGGREPGAGAPPPAASLPQV